MSAAAAVVLTAATLIALALSAPTAAPNDAGTIVLSGGTLVDGTGREPLTGATPPCQHCGKTNRLGSMRP